MTSNKFSILDLFDDAELKEKSDGNFQTTCPDCGLQGGRTEGFILFPESNTSYCHGSQKWFTLYQTAGLKLKVITCLDGNDKGEQPESREGLFDEINDAVEEEYGKEFLTDFKIACGNIGDFLYREYDKKGDLKTTKVNIDAVAHYLVNKYNFKTVFGKKNNSIWNCDGQIYTPKGKSIIETECEFLLNVHAKKNSVGEICAKVERLTKIDFEEFETTDVNLIPLRHNVLDVKNKKLLDYKPEYNFKFKIDVNYDKNAECPLWLKFINETIYPNDIKIIQEWFGFNLYREYFLKKGIICVGDQDTGKSVFLDTLIQFIGEKNKTGISLQSITHGTDFIKLSLRNKHSNVYDDLSSKDLSDGGAFKIATGGGYISAEEKFGEFIQFRSFAKHIFATNKIPPVRDNDDMAYFGRWMVLKFDNVPTNMDVFLRRKLWADGELSGILNWALIGLYRLLKNNKFSYDKTAEETKTIMEASGSPLAQFTNQVLVRDDGKVVTKEDMYDTYCRWTIKEKKPRFSKEQLGRQLPKYCFYILAKRNKKRIWENVKINENYELSVNNDTLDTSLKFKGKSIESEKSDNNILDISFEKESKESTSKNRNITKTSKSKKIKTDREVQYFDAEECKDIKSNHTKEDVLEWIKTNPKADYKKLYKKFGVGCLKFRNELITEGLIDAK